MKKIQYIHRKSRTPLFFWGCLFIITGVQSFLSGQISHTINFKSSDLSIHSVTAEDGNIYDEVTIHKLGYVEELGKPQLPVAYVNLIIPSDQEVDDVIIKHTDKQQLAVTHLIYPVQPPMPTSIHYKKPAFSKPDPDVYESGKTYPDRIVKVVHDGYFDGINHIVTLAVYPLQYSPKTGYLNFYQTVDFSLQLKAGKIKRIGVGTRSEKN